jgi:TonB family protein
MVDTSKHKVVGIAGTVGFHIAILLLLFLFGLKPQLPIPAEESILINFGDGDVGSGMVEPSAAQKMAMAAQRKQAVQQESPLTQDFEDAPMLPTKSISKRKPDVKATAAQPNATTTVEAPVEKPREVNKRALFPGKSSSNMASQGEGDGRGAGNQGKLYGSPDSKSRVGGSTGGSRGHSFSLNGRNIVGGFPNPDYNVQASGKVVVSITVDQNGSVTKATYSPKGSTTSDSRLIHAALSAAQKARFNTDRDAPSVQTGIILYIFNLQ